MRDIDPEASAVMGQGIKGTPWTMPDACQTRWTGQAGLLQCLVSHRLWLEPTVSEVKDKH